MYKVKGTVASVDADDALETTPVSMLAVPAQKLVFHRGRADLTWRKIDLARLDFAPRPGRARAREGRVRAVLRDRRTDALIDPSRECAAYIDLPVNRPGVSPSVDT